MEQMERDGCVLSGVAEEVDEVDRAYRSCTSKYVHLCLCLCLSACACACAYACNRTYFWLGAMGPSSERW